MPALLYGAPWHLEKDQGQASLDNDYEPLCAYHGHEPYMFLDGRQVKSGDELEVSLDGRPPLRCEVVGTKPARGWVVVKITVVRSDGPFDIRFTLSEGTLVRRAKREE